MTVIVDAVVIAPLIANRPASGFVEELVRALAEQDVQDVEVDALELVKEIPLQLALVAHAQAVIYTALDVAVLVMVAAALLVADVAINAVAVVVNIVKAVPLLAVQTVPVVVAEDAKDVVVAVLALALEIAEAVEQLVLTLAVLDALKHVV